MKPDLVYYYDTNKKTHRPLKYSIRSAEKNLEFRDIWIIGKKPDFLNDKVKEIYCEDTRLDKIDGRYKYFQRTKTQLAVDEPQISRNFVWMNDDFYILKKCDEIPYYHGGKLDKWIGKRVGYRKKTHGRLWINIIRKLKELFPDGYFYEVHSPMIFNKTKMKKILENIDNSLLAALKSVYCNTYGIEGEYTKDFKVYKMDQLQILKDGMFLSSRDKTESSWKFIQFLKKKFPEKSSYEV